MTDPNVTYFFSWDLFNLTPSLKSFSIFQIKIHSLVFNSEYYEEYRLQNHFWRMEEIIFFIFLIMLPLHSCHLFLNNTVEQLKYCTIIILHNDIAPGGLATDIELIINLHSTIWLNWWYFFQNTLFNQFIFTF